MPTAAAATASSTAAAPSADLRTLWQDHLADRRALKTLARDLAHARTALAEALAGGNGDPSPSGYAAWLKSIGIPPALASQLTDPIFERPQPKPDLTLNGLELTIRLDPHHATITRHAVTAKTSAGQALDPGRLLADSFAFQTEGELRSNLNAYWREHPGDFSREFVANLPPITVPNSQPHQFLPQYPVLSDFEVATRYARFLEIRRNFEKLRRDNARARRRRMPSIARLLALKQDELSLPGRASKFRGFLRSLHIPRPTAYRILASLGRSENGLNSGASAPTASASENGPILVANGPTFELRKDSVTLHLTPQEAAISHAALTYILKAAIKNRRPYDFSAHVATAFTRTLEGPALDAAVRLWNTPLEAFPPMPHILPTLRLAVA